MKILHLSWVAVLAMSANVAHSQTSPASGKPRFRDAATHDSLVAKTRKLVDPSKSLEASPTKEDPSIKHAPINLLDQSDILCFGGQAVLVPKRAILTVPAQYQGRCKFEKGSKIVPWAEFLTKNRGWVSTLEVTQEQAEGTKAMDEKTTEQVAKSSSVIVATYQNGPISVLPPKTGENTQPPPKQPADDTQNR